MRACSSFNFHGDFPLVEFSLTDNCILFVLVKIVAMEEVKGEDFRKSYPSLPPNYVSFVQLKERWIQQKQKEASQKEQIDSSENQQQQSKEDDNNNNRFNGRPPRTNSKNGLGRIHAQGLPVRRNGELRVDADTVLAPRRQSDQNYGKIRKGKGKWKSSSKVELQDSGLTGGSERGNAKDKNLYRRKNRRPTVKKKGLSEVDPAQTLSGNGVTSGGEEGYSSYENERVHETVSVCMVGLAPEIKGNEENPVSSSRKPPGKQVLDDQFPDSTDSLRVEAISLGKQVEDDQLFNTSDSRIVEAKPCGQQPVNGQFLNNAGAEGNVNEFEVLPKCVSVDEISGVRGRTSRIYKTKYGRYKRGGNDKGLLVEKNVFKQEVFRDNEEEEEVSLGEKRITSKEKLESRFQGNGGNSRINRISNEIRLKQGQELVGEDISMAKEERTDPAARTGNGAQVYGNKNRVYHRLEKDFGDLSIQGGRKGNSSRGHRWRHGNLGTGLHRKGKQVVEDGLVWVKKGERADSNSEIS